MLDYRTFAMPPLAENSSNSARHPNGPKTMMNPAIITLERYFNSNMYIYYGTVSPVITIFVIIINVLLITTLVKGKFRMSTHIMMISIAIADIFTGLVPLPFNIYIFTLESMTGYLTVTWCYVYEYMQNFIPNILHLSSLHLTIGLGIERFIVVAFPMKAKRICTFRNGVIFSIGIFLVSVCSQIDLLTEVSFESITFTRDTSNTTVNGCLRSPIVRTNAEYAIRVGISVLLPCLILMVFTLILRRKTKDIQQWRKQNVASNQQGGTTVQSLERLDLAVVLIMICIVVSEVTVHIGLLLSRIHDIRFTRTHVGMKALAHIVFQITSPLNFFILCFLSSKFRETLKEMFSCFKAQPCNGKSFRKDKHKNSTSQTTKESLTEHKLTERTRL